jgi:hypothetical protein
MHAYFAAYYKKNREQQLVAAKQWQKDHPEHRKEYCAEWYKANRDAQREAGRQYYDKNSEVFKRRARAWAKANPGAASAQTQRKNARKRNCVVGGPAAVAMSRFQKEKEA